MLVLDPSPGVIYFLGQSVIEPPLFDLVYVSLTPLLNHSPKRFASLFSLLRTHFSSLVLVVGLGVCAAIVFSEATSCTPMVCLSSTLMMAGLFGDTLLSAVTEGTDRGVAGPAVSSSMVTLEASLPTTSAIASSTWLCTKRRSSVWWRCSSLSRRPQPPRAKVKRWGLSRKGSASTAGGLVGEVLAGWSDRRASLGAEPVRTAGVASVRAPQPQRLVV